MKYGDLIQFDPIESVIQLLHANEPTAAEKLIASYVISPEMAAQIADIIMPQIGFGADVDHKGMMIIGNYGTGKSHLMSVLSSIAEDAGYLPLINNDRVRDAAAPIAGKLKVHRIEVAGEMSLRAIITSQLEEFLSGIGVTYQFPSVDKVVNNKRGFAAMMAAFEEKYPDQGILLVVDELLDYLRGRNDHQIVHDLSLLREIGELANGTRFRFMAGIQETIFEGGRFSHMADSLLRVKDRFRQIQIGRQDISFVVSERLLRKDADQSAAIRAHLEPFAKYYENMAERMDQFVRLFPVHPDYLRVFENIKFAEKRSALSTLSKVIRDRMEQDVPTDAPGLITYDTFWQEISGNAALRADHDVGQVVSRSGVLSEKIDSSWPARKASFKPMATRLIAGLSVHRLTTDDVHVAIGVTPSQLRDQLSLFHPLVADIGTEEAASDLLGFVETTLAEIMRTANGQFISRSPDSEQYYLDLKKDIDYDAQVAKRAETLDDSDLDKAYYSAILNLMERVDDDAHVPGHRIWQHDLEWNERRVDRSGYLFLGSPNDRPTAQPDRDFYVYFLQPFATPNFKDEAKEDEVFFRLADRDDALVAILRTYWAARDWAQLTSGPSKDVYAQKREEALRAMQRWLREHQSTAFQVSYRGKTKPMQDWLKGVDVRDRAHLRSDQTLNFRDMANVVAGVCLAPHFAETYPDYPTFSTIVTQNNRRASCIAALKTLAGGGRTKDGNKILDALKLMDGDSIDTSGSLYASALLDMLRAKPAGQVLNRSEIFEGDAAVEMFKPGLYGIEHDLVAVVIGALVASGDLVLSLPGTKIDSSSIGKLADHNLDDLINFKHIERPKDVDVGVLRQVFELFGLPTGGAQLAAGGDETAIRQIVDRAATAAKDGLILASGTKEKLTFWGQAILRDDEIEFARKEMDAVRTFSETIARYDTAGKLKNLRLTAEEVAEQKPRMATFRRVGAIASRLDGLASMAAYLANAELGLPNDDSWVAEARKAREEIASDLSGELDDAKATKIRQRLQQIKASYIDHYLARHAKARIGLEDLKTKQSLINDERRKALRLLRSVPILPGHEIDRFDDRIGALQSCEGIVASDLSASPFCPNCSYRPAREELPLAPPKAMLSQFDADLDGMLKSWAGKLREQFDDPITGAEGIDMAPSSQRDRIRGFADGAELPMPLDSDFVAAMRDALSGLVREELTAAQLAAALLDGGSPVTAEELRARFEKLLETHVKGKDISKVRFVVKVN
ncbi:DUF6079 family protein [Sphingomonas sp. PvP056]|uniref:DUF6079 family protein n=1 Tax=Sphingomonas sp. PvP056 TaxID=3156392 RepID=UPI00339214CA